MKKKVFTKVLACMLMLSVFAGSFFSQKVFAAPDHSQKAGAKEITLGLNETGKTLGTAPDEIKSTYYKVRTKRPYNLKISVTASFDITEEVEIQVWNSKDELLKSGSQSRASWSYDKKTEVSTNSFKINKVKKGTYYIEIKEKGSIADRDYTISVIPEMIERVKNVSATQKEEGSKKVVVKWTPLKGDAISGYKIYRKINGKYQQVKTVYGIKKKSVTLNVTPGKTYYFKVRAFYYSKASDKNNFSKYSKTAKVKTVKKD